MKHDVAFLNQAVPPLCTGSLNRDVAGPPMLKMLSFAVACGALVALALALTGTVGAVESLGVGWSTALAVLAIESAVYVQCASWRLRSRCSPLAWSGSVAKR